MTKVTIDDIVFDDPDQDIPRNPGPLDIEWWYEHRVQEYKISGYKDMTQRTSNEVLLHCRITIRTTETGGVKRSTKASDGYLKFRALQRLIKSAGPYKVQTSLWKCDEMYLKGSPKFRQVAGEDDWVGTWSLEFVEKYDG